LKATIKRLIGKYGFQNTIRFGAKVITDYIIFQLFVKDKKFFFKNTELKYFVDFNNGTHTNERIIEIPILLNYIKNYSGKSILEIGNVLSKYHNFNHVIIDKYEKDKEVLNQDVSEFCLQKKFDLIISVSTLEHVGFDEEEKDPNKILLGIKNLERHLKENGIIIVTLPLGYNFPMDKMIRESKIEFNQKYFLKRTSSRNTWKQVKEKDVFQKKYSSKFPPHTNELLVGLIKK